jgi:hypothetical protein
VASFQGASNAVQFSYQIGVVYGAEFTQEAAEEHGVLTKSVPAALIVATSDHDLVYGYFLDGD